MQRLALSACILLLIACDDSPVPPTMTLTLRGRAEPGIVVQMVNTSGMADRTAAASPDGSYALQWTGTDLSGTFGERRFMLGFNYASRSVWSTETFVVRQDMTLPPLFLWDSKLEATLKPNGDLVVGFQPVPSNQDYQPIVSYLVTAQYKRLDRDAKPNPVTRLEAVEIPATERGLELSPAEQDRLFKDRVSREIQFRITARGAGLPFDLQYACGWEAMVSIPVTTEIEAKPR